MRANGKWRPGSHDNAPAGPNGPPRSRCDGLTSPLEGGARTPGITRRTITLGPLATRPGGAFPAYASFTSRASACMASQPTIPRGTGQPPGPRLHFCASCTMEAAARFKARRDLELLERSSRRTSSSEQMVRLRRLPENIGNLDTDVERYVFLESPRHSEANCGC